MLDRFSIYNAVIDIPLKANTFIIFEYVFNSEYINIPLVINLKIDDVLEKDFNIHLKEFNKIRHIFKLDYNITKINFYLYLYNNEIYNDENIYIYIRRKTLQIILIARLLAISSCCSQTNPSLHKTVFKRSSATNRDGKLES